ncbi:hypothetical protein FB451DRAFT_1184499 [Mycena latifolia]|nr:hypothetical protein FB451DRAFT_1184499 [Mycena latifolia]
MSDPPALFHSPQPIDNPTIPAGLPRHTGPRPIISISETFLTQNEGDHLAEDASKSTWLSIFHIEYERTDDIESVLKVRSPSGPALDLITRITAQDRGMPSKLNHGIHGLPAMPRWRAWSVGGPDMHTDAKHAPPVSDAFSDYPGTISILPRHASRRHRAVDYTQLETTTPERLKRCHGNVPWGYVWSSVALPPSPSTYAASGVKMLLLSLTGKQHLSADASSDVGTCAIKSRSKVTYLSSMISYVHCDPIDSSREYMQFYISSCGMGIANLVFKDNHR